MVIEKITVTNFDAVAQIYAEGIATGMATFETQIPSWNKWNQSHLPYGRIVAVDQNILGWAALSPVSSRCVYGGVAEVSVYVGEAARGNGVGRYLLEQLIAISEQNGIWTLQSGIMRQNTVSIALHEKCGFRQIGYREKVAQLNGEWLDNVLMERRSRIVGIQTD